MLMVILLKFMLLMMPTARSGSGSEASMRKVKGTIHWVSVPHAVKAEVRIYDRLFTHENPDGDKDS